MRSKFMLIAFLCLVSLVVKPVEAGDDQESENERLNRIQEKILQEQKRLEELKINEKSIFGQLHYLENLIDLQRRRSAALYKEWGQIEKRIADSDAQRAEIEVSLAERRELLGRRFRRMYIDGTSGALEVLLTADSFADFSVREVYYRALMTADSEMIRTFMNDIGILKELRRSLEEEKSRLAPVMAEISAAKAATEKERAAKENLLRACREDREMHEAVLRELNISSRKIGGIIVSYEERARQASLPPQPPPAISITPSAPSHPAGESTAPQTPARPIEPAPTPTPEPSGETTVTAITPPVKAPLEPLMDTGFGMNAGRMCAPCSGSLVQRYGTITNPQFGTKTFSKGVALAAAEGTAVKAVWDGEVIYAGWFQGYGRMVILSHGNRYYTLYAHLSSIAAGKGNKVSRGQIVGYVGDTGSLEGPRLYFEVRRGAGSLNPMSWINLGCGG